MSSKVDRPSAIAEAMRPVLGKLKRKLREQGTIGDLTPSQTSVLSRLEKDGPATVSSLARAEGMRPQSMGAIVSELEGAGYVRGAPDKSDGRQTLWSLTERCRETIRRGRAAREDWLARRIATLSPKEQDHLAATIALFERIVDEGTGDP
jgi:DNA-binding MarR family transcriptional regulator